MEGLAGLGVVEESGLDWAIGYGLMNNELEKRTETTAVPSTR